MNFAGLPPHISLSGISLVTIEPAPTIELSPIDIFLHITEFAPMKQACPILTFPVINVNPFYGNSGER